ncbi:Long-chain fatty acid transport protein [Mariprofundus ferrinatatus]|uniref:Long-chain fatty acid transport protein n=1 Tax=Mariprofundus ferrinatatus TaxID=1921087 RepID=A0A2K8L3B5_9PROT|nr:outer membrane protein transport protein [Mariprofundus ferrinatatus]ATX81592.1 Long-chain fatty acid transport protein [Mariprofundus ferrinatatus]
MKRNILLVSMLFAGISTAQAGGYMVGEMATRATGMASAFTAVADDASAAWHNPAGVAFTEGRQLMLGSAVILTSNDFTSNSSNLIPAPATSVKAKDGTFFIPHAYFTYWDEESSLGASLSINSPFGLETDWPTTGLFASKNTFSRINMVMINPSVIFEVSGHLSFAAGVDYAYVNKVDLNNTAQLLSGDGDGWGGNASILYKGDSFNFGVTYRSRIKVDIKNGLITGGPALAGVLPALVGATTTGNTSLTLPDQLNVGFAFMPNEQWTLSFDADWVNWKTFKEIRIQYTPSLLSTVLTGGTNVNTLPENWKATIDLRAGAEWKYLPNMRARFGYIFSPTPIKDVDFSPSIPGNDRHIVSIGHGYDFTPETTLDLAYAYVHINKRNQTQSTGGTNALKNGTYKGNAHILMASINHRF